MRTSSIVISVLFGAGALAHPTLQNLHLHQKRKTWDSVHKWQKGGVQYEEFEAVETITLPAGAQIPAAATPTTPSSSHPSSSVAAARIPIYENKVAPADGGRGHVYHHKPQPETTSAQQSPPENTYKPSVVVPSTPSIPATSSQEPQETATSPGSGSSGTCSKASVVGGSAADWANEPCSGGKSIKKSFNDMRAKWQPALANAGYEWSSQLAANARLTAVSPVVNVGGVKQNEGGATEMNHKLNPGSMAQCIASGDGTTTSGGLTPFETALKMWLCEIPGSGNPLGCDNTGNSGDIGHAEIIQSTSYTKVGVYYMDSTGDSGFTGMWTADFA